MRRRIFEIIDSVNRLDPLSQIYDVFIVLVSIVSILPLTVNAADVPPSVYELFRDVDMIAIYILFFDYMLRWTTHDLRSGITGVRGFFYYPFTPRAIVTLLSLLPTLTPLPRLFALLRLVNLYRVTRYSKSLNLVIRAVRSEEKALASTIVLLIGYIFCSAIVVYVAEPQTFKNFLEALYWSTLANTSVGYADVITVSPLGRAVSMISALISIAAIALPSGIVTAGLMAQMVEIRRQGEDVYYKDVVTFSHMRNLIHQARKSISIATADMEGVQLFPYLRWLIRNNMRVVIFITSILACLALNLALYLLKPVLGLPIWLDMSGTALAAMMINPLAGLLVGFLSNLTMAILSNGTSSLLFFFENAITALVFGLFFGRGKKITIKSFLALFVFAILLESQYSVWMDLIFSYTTDNSLLNLALSDMLQRHNAPSFVYLPLVEVIEKAIEITFTLVISYMLFQVIEGTNFDPLVAAKKYQSEESILFSDLLERIDSVQGEFNANAFAKTIGDADSPNDLADEEANAGEDGANNHEDGMEEAPQGETSDDAFRELHPHSS